MQVAEDLPEATGEEADTSSSAYTPGKAEAGNSGAFTYSFLLKLHGRKIAWNSPIPVLVMNLNYLQRVFSDTSRLSCRDLNGEFRLPPIKSC
ncbi:MAG: hypothetical protein JXB88_02705 [Spirochaetales bacterium]|nr:hypothetical protein [Spirochaetales bacterium]